MKKGREKKIPIGIEDFEKLRTDNFYYIDKTGLIRELLENWGEVNLFTRPRRFGKSLNMSMLRHFLEEGTPKDIFAGLEISKEKELCEEFMGRFPVVFVSLKGIQAGSYEMACRMGAQVINSEARRFQYLLTSEALLPDDKEAFRALLKSDMDESVLCGSLRVLSELLYKHHQSKVVLLVDEYDVPLVKAFQYGYYDQMAILIQIGRASCRERV